MIKNYRKIGFEEVDAILDESKTNKPKSMGLSYEIAAAGLNLPGEIVRTQAQTMSINGERREFQVDLVSKEQNGNTHRKYLEYTPFMQNYVLGRELTLKNGKHEGLQYVYDKQGALDRLAFYENNKMLCDMSKELRSLQIQDKFKAAFGVKRRDAETLNSDQIGVLKQRHPELKW